MNSRFTEQQIESFVNYCWVFYGEGGIYPEFFPGLSKAEIEAAVKVLSGDPNFGAIDSVDREQCRDYLRLKNL